MASLDPGTPSSYVPQQATSLTPTGEGTVGVYATYPGPGIYLDILTLAYPSDNFVVPFAFHWPYATPVYVIQIWHQFAYDNSEVKVLSMVPAGPFVGANNFPGPTTWSAWDFSEGTWYVGDVLGTGVPLWCNPPSEHLPLSTTNMGKFTVTGSGIYPFMSVSVHIKSAPSDAYLDMWVNQFALLFKFSSGDPGTWWTAGALGTPTYGIGFIPEPASLSLLGLGLISVGAGVWRRRR
jgi:hypothetical protein